MRRVRRFIALALAMIACAPAASPAGSVGAGSNVPIEDAGRYELQDLDATTRLGDEAARRGDHEAAIEYYKRAQHILHRHHGVHTLLQQDLVDAMARSYLALADVETADRLMRFRYELGRANFGDDDPRVVPAMLELANWHQARARFNDALGLYDRALRLLGEHDIGGRALQRTLNMRSYTQYLNGRCCRTSDVESGVQAILADATADFADRARAKVHAGDLLIMSGEWKTASELYSEASSSTGSGDSIWLGVANRQQMIAAYRLLIDRVDRHRAGDARQGPPGKLVGSPVPVCLSAIEDLTPDDEDHRDYAVDLEFTVTVEGRARGVEITESNAPLGVEMLAKRLVRTSRFRPAILAGRAVEESVQWTQRFAEAVVPSSDTSPFPPANVAIVQGCQALVRFRK